MTNKQVAYTLGISEQTVKNHMSSILRKPERERPHPGRGLCHAPGLDQAPQDDRRMAARASRAPSVRGGSVRECHSARALDHTMRARLLGIQEGLHRAKTGSTSGLRGLSFTGHESRAAAGAASCFLVRDQQGLEAHVAWPHHVARWPLDTPSNSRARYHRGDAWSNLRVSSSTRCPTRPAIAPILGGKEVPATHASVHQLFSRPLLSG
jgi:hypothetical protein